MGKIIVIEGIDASGKGTQTLKLLEWLKEHARANGFKRLTLTSPRKGWARLFTPVSTNYEMEL